MLHVPKATCTVPTQVKAVILDWAGTTVDFGSRAPVIAMQAAFKHFGVDVNETEVRGPMGRAKPDHLHMMLQLPRIAALWESATGRAPDESSVVLLYERFLTDQHEVLAAQSAVIPGCVEAVDACRKAGLVIGSSTGYSRPQLDIVAERARAEGYSPDVALSADDVQPGRPEPWLCLENARRLGVYPMSAIVKVDDTPSGIAAGRNAGAWAVGVIASGNEVGLTSQQLDALPAEERDSLLAAARARLTEAGAHLLIDTIADLPEAVAHVNELLAAKAKP